MDNKKTRLLKLRDTHEEAVEKFNKRQKVLDEERTTAFDEIRKELNSLSPFYSIKVKLNGRERSQDYGLYTTLEEVNETIDIVKKTMQKTKCNLSFDVGVISHIGFFELSSMTKSNNDIAKLIIFDLKNKK
jgi:hypothetical protein